MREVKFRAWDEENARMQDWEYLRGYCDVDHLFGGFYERDKGPSYDYPVAMQYTGLKDKKGREIYEGDIYRAINRNFESEVRGKITYLHGCYMFGNWNAQEFFNKHQHIEVIGNIYQNPNLLEDSQ